MVNHESLNHLFGEVHNLEQFEHPEYRRHFEYLSNKQVIGLAKEVVELIGNTGVTTVAVSETGAMPFVLICSRIGDLTGRSINWLPVKFPRDPVENVYPVLVHYLNQDELQTPLPNDLEQVSSTENAVQLIPPEKPRLGNVLKQTEAPVNHPFVQNVSSLMASTEIAQKLSPPFLYFDEYLDSGTTLRNAHIYFHMLVRSPEYKIGAYYANVENPGDYKNLSFALYNRKTQEACYSYGAYPYENRLDLIGYYYVIGNNVFRRVPVESLIEENPAREVEAEYRNFLNYIRETVQRYDLLPAVQRLATIPAVRGSITEDHLVRFYMYQFEKDTSDEPATTEFLWQLFELYGPIWSPLPDEYHLDYLQAFSDFTPYARLIPEYNSILEIYQQNRKILISTIASICEERRKVWLNQIEEDLQKYEF